jgi:hypothetical protein
VITLVKRFLSDALFAIKVLSLLVAAGLAAVSVLNPADPHVLAIAAGLGVLSTAAHAAR